MRDDVVQLDGFLNGIRPGLDAAQRRHAPAAAERGADVVAEGADVGALRAVDTQTRGIV